MPSVPKRRQAKGKSYVVEDASGQALTSARSRGLAKVHAGVACHDILTIRSSRLLDILLGQFADLLSHLKGVLGHGLLLDWTARLRRRILADNSKVRMQFVEARILSNRP